MWPCGHTEGLLCLCHSLWTCGLAVCPPLSPSTCYTVRCKFTLNRADYRLYGLLHVCVCVYMSVWDRTVVCLSVCVCVLLHPLRHCCCESAPLFLSWVTVAWLPQSGESFLLRLCLHRWMSPDIYSSSGVRGQIMYVFVCKRAFVCVCVCVSCFVDKSVSVHPVVNRLWRAWVCALLLTSEKIWWIKGGLGNGNMFPCKRKSSLTNAYRSY